MQSSASFPRYLHIILGLGLLLSCLSCAHLQKADPEDMAAQWKQRLEARDYAGAIDVYAAAVRRQKADRDLQRLYLRAAETLRDLGEREYNKREFGQAEKIYSALVGTYRGFAGLAVRPSFTIAELRDKLALARIGDVEASARLHILRGDYRKALDIYKAALRRFAGEARFLRVYADAVEEIKQSADTAFAREDFAVSGQICRMLMTDFDSFTPFVRTLSFRRDSLGVRIGECSTSLTRKGLELYRQGNISSAVAVWETVIVFDDNPEVRKMIETASQQTKKLQR